jgi:hypothetical protein
MSLFINNFIGCINCSLILSQNYSPKSHQIPLITTRSPQASIFRKTFHSWGNNQAYVDELIVKIGIVKSDSIHHFLENASTKSGTLQFPPFSGCELWIYHFVYDGSCLSLQTNISRDYLNLSLADEHVGDVTIPTQVIEYNQNVLQVDYPIRLKYSNQIKLYTKFLKYILIVL